MWLVTVYCSAESWRNAAQAFNAIVGKYAVKPLSTKKMKDDERRIMTFEVEDVGDAEAFQEECMTLDGFTAHFESL
ncbi:MAG: hypothetical protein ACAF41_13765 [Leptolyngbya sp. BL-A-14]